MIFQFMQKTLRSVFMSTVVLLLMTHTLPAYETWTLGQGVRQDRLKCLGFNLQAPAAETFVAGPGLMKAQSLTHTVGVLRVEFQPDQDDSTTGNGLFGNLPFFQPIGPDTFGVEVDPTINSRSRFYFYKHLQWAGEYFEVASGGLFTFAGMDTTTDISPIIQLNKEMGAYGDNKEFTQNMITFVNESIQMADTLTSFDFSPYDALIIFHAGAGEESDFGPPPLYPGDSPRDLHSAYIPFEALREYLGEGDPAYRGIKTVNALGETTYVKNALVLPETLIQDTVYNPSAVFLDILGIVLHEYGHHLGLPDLYDPAHPTRPAVGNFGLMGTGAYNSSGRLPSEPIGWSKYYLGWDDAFEINSDTTGVELSAMEGVGSGNRLLRIPISSSEYYLLENRVRDRDFDGEFRFYDVDGDNWPDLETDGYRMPDGTYTEFDYALPGIITYPDDPLPGSGVFIWHIDNEVIRGAFDPDFNNNCVNCNINRQGVDLEEADGIQHLDELYPQTIDPGYGSPFDSYGGKVEGIKDFASLNLLFGPSTNPSSTSNLGMATNISISGFRSLTVNPSQSLVDTIVGIDVSFEERVEGFPVVLRLEDALDFEEDPSLFEENSMAFADLDGDESAEIVTVTAEGDLYVIDSSGNFYPEGSSEPTPYASVNRNVHSSPALGDLDGDEMADLEITLLSDDGSLYAFSSRGPSGGDVILPGFPVTFEGTVHHGPLCFDVDGNGLCEVITTSLTQNGLTIHVTDGSGSSLEGWPLVLEGESSGFPVIYPHIESGTKADSADIVFASSEGTVYRISKRGNVLWQVSLGSEIRVPPVLADLDRDGDRDGDNIAEVIGDLEIAVGTLSGQVHVITAEGGELPGGPQSTSGQIRSPIAASDVDRDGFVELIVLTESPWELHLFRLNNSSDALLRVRNFPKQVITQSFDGSKQYYSSPVIADIDTGLINNRRGEEILFGTQDDRVLVYDVSTASAPIKEYPLGGNMISSPVVGDLDGDGDLDIMAADDRGYVYAWSTGSPTAETRISWGQLGSVPGRTYANIDSLVMAIPSEAPVWSEDSVYVYPNPYMTRDHARATLHFEVDTQFTDTRVYVYDVSGRKVKTIDLFDNTPKQGGDFWATLDIDDLSSGVYILALEVTTSPGGKKRLFKKFAVVR